MIKPTVSVVNRSQIEEALKELQKRLGGDVQVLVGVPSGAGAYEDGLTIATIAAVNEFGSANGNIPARPFLRPAIEDNAPMYTRLAEKDLPDIIRGVQPMSRLLHRLGAIATSNVQRKIVEGPFVANASSTVRAKGSSSPLIDTGALRQSINYEIVDTRDIEEGVQTTESGGSANVVTRVINAVRGFFRRPKP